MPQATLTGTQIKFGVDLLAMEMEGMVDQFINTARVEQRKLMATGMSKQQALKVVMGDLKNIGNPKYSGIFSGLRTKVKTIVREHEKQHVAKPIEEIGKTNKKQRFFWVLGAVKSDHCADCYAHSSMEPKTRDEWISMGKGLPRWGMTICNIGCKCMLQPVPRGHKVPPTKQELKKARDWTKEQQLKKQKTRGTSHLAWNMAGKHTSVQDSVDWMMHNVKTKINNANNMTLGMANELTLATRSHIDAGYHWKYTDVYVRDLGKSTYASSGSTHLNLNPRYLKDPKDLVKSYDKDVDSQWHPKTKRDGRAPNRKGTANYVEQLLHHEFGHMMSIRSIAWQDGFYLKLKRLKSKYSRKLNSIRKKHGMRKYGGSYRYHYKYDDIVSKQAEDLYENIIIKRSGGKFKSRTEFNAEKLKWDSRDASGKFIPDDIPEYLINNYKNVGIDLTKPPKFKTYNEFKQFQSNLNNSETGWYKMELNKLKQPFMDEMDEWWISTYAHKNMDEFFAECFTSYRHTPKHLQSPIVKEFGKIVDQYFKGDYYDNNFIPNGGFRD